MEINFNNIPDELKQRPQWVLWKLTQKPGEKKPRKVPYTIHGEPAKSNDPNTWSTFQDIVKAFRIGGYNGIGYVFSKDDPYTGIDLDGDSEKVTEDSPFICMIDGELTDTAQSIIAELDSYSEYSQSGTGVHIIVKGMLPGEGNKIGNIEMYDSGRFFAFTGNRLAGSPTEIAERQEEINRLHEMFFPKKQETKEKPKSPLQKSPPMDDETIIEKAKKAKHKEKFIRLFVNGDISGYRSQSEADQALCNMLAFYTQDPEQIDRLFRKSALYREKWEREDYSERTISKAIDGLKTTYRPKPTVYDDFREDMNLVHSPNAPMKNATLFHSLFFVREGIPTLYFYRGIFYEWEGSYYREITQGEMKERLYKFFSDKEYINIDKNGEKSRIPFSPNKTKIANILDALEAVSFLPDHAEMPCWISTPKENPTEYVPLKNGLLHLPTGEFSPPTPTFFNSYALPFDYKGRTSKPYEWIKFLRSIWGDDDESIETLQEIFGLLLTPDTRYQKIFLINGPKRSGKGTITSVLKALLGENNFSGPTLNSLATNFGLAPLIGKSVAVISDARLSGRADQTVIVERLLSISGEDTITIDRKFKEPWTGKLGVRFLITTNELPEFGDSSGAFSGRLIILKMTKSFYGKEDKGLKERLFKELPEILNWSIEGWRRLNTRGYFKQPSSAQDLVEDMESLTSPVMLFIRESCVLGPSYAAKIQDLYNAWKYWCWEHGIEKIGSRQAFSAALRSAVPEISTGRIQVGGERKWHFKGIKLSDGNTQQGENENVDFIFA